MTHFLSPIIVKFFSHLVLRLSLAMNSCELGGDSIWPPQYDIGSANRKMDTAKFAVTVLTNIAANKPLETQRLHHDIPAEAAILLYEANTWENA